MKDDNTEDIKSSIAALLAESIDKKILNDFESDEIYYLYLDLHVDAVADITCVNINVREQIQGDYKILPNGRSPPRTICMSFSIYICLFVIYIIFSKKLICGFHSIHHKIYKKVIFFIKLIFFPNSMQKKKFRIQ